MSINPSNSSWKEGRKGEVPLTEISIRKDIETEVPVPDRLFHKRRSKELLNSLKLSQKIGLLLWLNKNEALSEGGKERLLYLQRKASEEAILAGLKFSSRLQKEEKLRLDFKPHMVELNRRPQSRRFRVSEKRRIGIGYRDKGTLPDIQSKLRNQTQEESFIFLSDLPEMLQEMLYNLMPSSIEGEWVDLEEIGRLFSTKFKSDRSHLLNQL